MNKISVGGFIRVSMQEARKRYNAGEVIRLCPVKFSPVNLWHFFADCQKEEYSKISGDGFNTVVARDREFETVVNAFRYYNCNSESGYYPAFYIREVVS